MARALATGAIDFIVVFAAMRALRAGRRRG
jgi:hypothetical protein